MATGQIHGYTLTLTLSLALLFALVWSFHYVCFLRAGGQGLGLWVHQGIQQPANIKQPHMAAGGWW